MNVILTADQPTIKYYRTAQKYIIAYTKYQESQVSIQEYHQIEDQLKISSPNIVNIIQSEAYSLSTTRYQLKVLEPLNKSLLTINNEKDGKGFTEEQIIYLLSELSSAIFTLHSQSYIATGLRLDTIHLGQDSHFKIGSLGYCTQLNHNIFPINENYIDPTSPIANLKTDIYLCGIVAHVLMYNKYPSVSAMRISLKPYNKLLVDICNSMLEPDINLRPSVECIMESISNIKYFQYTHPIPVLNENKLITTYYSPSRDNIEVLVNNGTRGWVVGATLTKNSPPNPLYVEKLCNKAWKKPHKIHKFYDAISHRNADKSTLVALKCLNLVQQYIFAGPLQVIANIAVVEFLSSLRKHWSSINLMKTQSSNDPLRSQYFSNFICEYCELLINKISVIQTYHNFIDNSFQLLHHPDKMSSILLSITEYLKSSVLLLAKCELVCLSNIMKGISLNLGEEINAVCLLIFELKGIIDETIISSQAPTFNLIQMAIANSDLCNIIKERFAMINDMVLISKPKEQSKTNEAIPKKETEDPFLKDSNVFLTTLRASFYNRILCLNDSKPTENHKTLYLNPDDKIISDLSHPNLMVIYSIKENVVVTEKYSIPLSSILYEANPKLTIKQKLKLILDVTKPMNIYQNIGILPH